MEDKQLTLNEVLKNIIRSECISCGEKLKRTNSWRIPLCRKCREEAAEDLKDYL